ncbi:uncharacterized protein OCT59_005791 [Rhizophagus irregularis]|uniref:uncharacterized protein n=1 Tax=Rhizophagus irregularis TaxID=588596 RepID=UPI003323F876|nr:hypothetical protein OCT59_005791 [Rhizophagus irregularis]
MVEIKLSDNVFEQIKDFKHWKLSEEQESLIVKLITDKELKERYKKYDLCEGCKQPNTSYEWCQPCISNHFQQNFKNWTSGNHDVDEFIQKAQLKAKDEDHIIEWIEYDKFEDVEYLAKGGFGTTFKAVWKDGPWKTYDISTKQLERESYTKVALKCLHNSQDISADFLKEVESNILAYNTALIVRCFVLDIINQCWDADPLKRPNADELYELIGGLLSDIRHNRVDSVIYKQVKETDDINKKLSFSSPLLKSTGTISYMTHPQAVYTSRLLNFKDLPEPTNADNNDDLLGMEYSDSLKMDFTKLDINSKDENN